MKTKRYGIIGGGQLGLFLANAALKLGIKPRILAEGSEAPAFQADSSAVLGSHEEEEDLNTLFSQADTILFENEFVNCEKLKKVSLRWGTQFFPSLEAISLMQDKLSQKEILKKLGIPTAEFQELNFTGPSGIQLREFQKDLELKIASWGGVGVLKWAKYGYDGLGVYFLDLAKPNWDSLLRFMNEASKRKTRVFVEKKVDFKRELAILGVQSVTGEFKSYPLVISEQDSGVCSRVYGPACALGVPIELERLASDFAKRLAEFVGLTGVFALEFFETKSGELCVNEIAPRVHNSGHYTLDGCSTDQFENHWRAILGLPLGVVSTAPAFAMINFLGPDLGSSKKIIIEDHSLIPQSSVRTHLHWYGKKEIRARRKLGHLNGAVSTVQGLDSLLEEMEAVAENWRKRIL